MDNPNITFGKWEDWMRKMQSEGRDWKSMFLGDWEISNDAVHSREEIDKKLRSGEITRSEADALLRMRYRIKRNGVRVIDESEKEND